MYNHLEIERHLIALIRYKKNEKEELEEVFRDMGYREASKICLLLDIIDSPTFNELMIFNRVRNQVAHGLKIKNEEEFNKKRKAGMELNLKIVKQTTLVLVDSYIKKLKG